MLFHFKAACDACQHEVVSGMWSVSAPTMMDSAQICVVQNLAQAGLAVRQHLSCSGNRGLSVECLRSGWRQAAYDGRMHNSDCRQPQALRQPDTAQIFDWLVHAFSLFLLLLLYWRLQQVERGTSLMLHDLQLLEQRLHAHLQSEAGAERDRLLQEANHDLRTRLQAVQLLALGVQQDAPPAMRTQTRKLNLALAQLQQFVEQYLDFSRLQQSVQEPTPVRIHLQDLFQRLELQFEGIAIEKQLDLQIRFSDLQLVSDAQMLERVLANLLSNALKFARHRVLVSARRRRDAIWIEVRDDGPGIAEAEQKMVFKAFYRSRQTQAQSGVGLGLAIVQRLLQVMHYRIELISHPGRGSLLRVVIPCARSGTE